MITRYLNPKNDVAFKRIFGTEKNKDILITMLNAVLKKQIHKPLRDVQFISPIQDRENLSEKQSIVDVLCKDQDGCKYIIEMQIDCQKDFKQRAIFYASKAYISQIRKGGKYQDLNKVIFLAFLSESLFAKKTRYKSDHQIRDIVSNEQDLENLAFTFVELDKFQVPKGKNLSQLSMDEKFYYFLKHAQDMSDEELAQLLKDSPIMKHAFDELITSYWTPEEIERYEATEKRLRDYYSSMENKMDEGIEKGLKRGREEGKREGLKEGLKKGREEGKQETAKQMLANGESVAKIQQYTGLSSEEIKKLISS